MLEYDIPLALSDTIPDSVVRQRIGAARRRAAAIAQRNGKNGTLRPFQALEQIHHLELLGDAFGMAEVLQHTAFSHKNVMYRALRHYGLPRE